MKIGGNTFQEFQDCAKENKIVAFAASDFLKYICESYPELELEEKITYVVDNNVWKQGKTIKLINSTKEIYSIEKLMGEDISNTAILITSDIYGYEIFEQISNTYPLFKMKCFILSLMISKHTSKSCKVNRFRINSEERVIPKKIHYFWFSNEKKSELVKECINSWREACPDYDIIEWNSYNYDITSNAYMKDAYEAGNWAYVSDYARLDVIYQYGGIYLDTDLKLIKSLEQFLTNDFFIGFGPIRDIEAAAFGARKHHAILLELLNIYNNMKYEATNLLNVQPVYLKRFFEKKGFEINGEYQKKDGIVLYPKEYFSPVNWFTKKEEITKETVGIHYCVGGWMGEKRQSERLKKIDGNRKLERLLYMN